MVQVNGSVMVPAELTNQRSSPGNNNDAVKAELKLEGIPDISEDNEEFVAFLKLVLHPCSSVPHFGISGVSALSYWPQKYCIGNFCSSLASLPLPNPRVRLVCNLYLFPK